MSKTDIQTEVARVAEVLKLGDYLMRKPGQLSGGQRQRVAIGRAMVRDPHLFLFDEPLSNLYAKLRNEMRAEIKRIHKALSATIAYVTHDQAEAMTLAGKIVLLNSGQIEQLGTPEKLYMHPDTLFAARFIGTPEINTPNCVVSQDGDGYAVNVGDVVMQLPASAARTRVDTGTKAVLAVRPEGLIIGEYYGLVTLGHAVELCEPMGSETYMLLDFNGDPIRLRAPGLVKLKAGSSQSVTWDVTGAHLFDPETERHL